MPESILTVVFERSADLAAQRKHLSHGALFVPEPDPAPEPFADLILCVVAPGDESVDLAASVLQILQGRIAVRPRDPAAATALLTPLFDKADAVAPEADAGGAPRCVWGRVAMTRASLRAQGIDDAAATQIHDAIATMTTAQKIQLALKGDRGERLVLIRDINKTLQTFVLQNPRVTIDEVKYLAGYKQASPDALNAIAMHREWGQNPNVVAALVRNPKTPGTIAAKLLEKLPIAELRRLAKSSDVPRAVSIAARKRVNEP